MQADKDQLIQMATFLFVFFCYTYFIHYIGPESHNVSSRMNLTAAIVEQGSFIIDEYHGNTGDKAYYNGHYYCDKAPGTSLLAVPFYYCFRLTGLVSEKYTRYLLGLFVVGLPSALLSLALLSLLKMSGVESQLTRVIITLSYSLGTLAFPFSTVFYGHQLAAFFGFLSFYILYGTRLKQVKPKPGMISLAGFLAGWAYLTDFPAGIIMGLLSVYCFLIIERKEMILWWAGGCLIPIMILFTYNFICFDSPFACAYTYHCTFDHQGGYMGIGFPRADALWGITFGSYRGIFFQTPVLLLLFPGGWLMFRKKEARQEFWLYVSTILAFLTFNAGFKFWHGIGSVGARFLIPCIPFMILLSVEAVRKWRIQAMALMALSITTMMFVSATEPRALWNIKNPLLNFNFFLLKNGCLSENLSEVLLGLEGPVSLIPLLLVAAGFLLLITRSLSHDEQIIPARTDIAVGVLVLGLVVSWHVCVARNQDAFSREFNRAETLFYHYRCQGKIDPAIIRDQFITAIAADPRHYGPYLGLADLAARQGDLQKALRYYDYLIERGVTSDRVVDARKALLKRQESQREHENNSGSGSEASGNSSRPGNPSRRNKKRNFFPRGNTMRGIKNLIDGPEIGLVPSVSCTTQRNPDACLFPVPANPRCLDAFPGTP